MKQRWTIKELESTSDLEFIQTILLEQQVKLNPYSPLYKKFASARELVKDMIDAQRNHK